MKSGDDITIRFTFPESMTGGEVYFKIGDILDIIYTNITAPAGIFDITIPDTTSYDWPAGIYPAQVKYTSNLGVVTMSDIQQVYVEKTLFDVEEVEENNTFPYSLPFSF